VRLDGPNLRWDDNTSNETGFRLGFAPVVPAGGSAIIFFIDVSANTTVFDLRSDDRTCSGSFHVSVSAILPDGTSLASGQPTIDVGNLCDQEPAPTTAPAPTATREAPALPATGTGDPQGRSGTPVAILAAVSLTALVLASTFAFRQRRTR
jgi:hypothetical protein